MFFPCCVAVVAKKRYFFLVFTRCSVWCERELVFRLTLPAAEGHSSNNGYFRFFVRRYHHLIID